MVETQRPWEDLIRQLHAGFRQIDEERALLRDIDQAIVRSTVLNGEGTDLIEHTFLESLRRFSQIHRLTEPGLCYVYTGDTLELLDDPDCLPSRPTSLPTCPAIKMLTHLSEQPCRCVALLRNPDTEVLYSKLAGTKFAVVCPVFSPLKQLLCLLLFLDNEIMEGSDLGSGEFEQSLASVGTQLSIAYEHVWRAQQNTRMRELWDLFLSADLSPSKCFKQLASAIPDFLPQFGPLRLPTPPGVQILVPASLSEDDKPTHLVIRATTANEPDTTRIDISKSITGLLVERSPEELPYFCDDPHRTVYGERYRNYLSASKDAQVRTEFAVRLKGKDDKLVGILNLESAIDNAFNIHHRKAIVDLLPHIAPMVAVFEERLRSNSLMNRSVAATAATYLDSLASVFRHGMGTPEANLRTDVDLLEKLLHQEHDACVSSIRRAFEKGNTDAFGQSMHEVEKTIHSATKALSRLLLVGNQITTFAEEFAHGISGFGDFGRIDIVRILHETVALVSNSLLAKSDADIRIHIKGEKKADVFCSPLIKQHLFCLLHNAILSIQERLSQTSEPPGVVNIDVSLDSPKESTKEVQLNKMWLVKIHDNGRGVTPEQLEDLRQFRPGTRFRSSRGQGYALPAAQRYLASVGGRIWINSEEGKFFEVFLMFDPFRSDVHESLVVHRS